MKYIINISEFNEIVNGIKAIKSDYVCIYNDLLLGTDYTMSTLRIYKMPIVISIPSFTIISKELSSNFFSNIIDTNIVIDFDESKIYCPNNKSYADVSNPMLNNLLGPVIDSIYNRLRDNINTSFKFIDFGYITEDESFQQFKTIKAADGSILYEPNGNSEYGMYIYSGSLPLNKNDILSLAIYDSGSTFISEFTVYKKKLNPIKVYFRFAKLRQSRA